MVEPIAVEHQEAARLGEQIGAAGECCSGRDVRPGRGGGDPPGRRILADVARIEAGDDDMVEPGAGDRPEIGRRQDPPFFNAVAPSLKLWARIAPSASVTGISPNCIASPSPCPSPRERGEERSRKSEIKSSRAVLRHCRRPSLSPLAGRGPG